jgi:hypothetical protein
MNDLPGDWSVPEGWYGCACCCPDRNAHAAEHSTLLDALRDEALLSHGPPRMYEDHGAYVVELKYRDDLTLISRATSHKPLAEALVKQHQQIALPRWQMIAYTGFTPRGQEKMKMNIKKGRKKGQCDAMRCTDTPLVADFPGAVWGVESVDLCSDHFERALKDHPEIQADVDAKLATTEGGAELAPAGVATAVVTSEETQEADLLARKKDAENVSKMARAWPMEDPEALEDLAEILTLVKGQRDDLEGETQEVTKPLATELEKRRAVYRPLKKALAEAESAIKSRFAQHRVEEEERNYKLKQAAATAHEEGRAGDVEKNLSKVTHLNDTEGVQTRLKWDFLIEDASKLPREFLMPNEKLIKEHCNHSTDKEPTPIPGVRFVPDAVVSGKRATR